MFRVFAFGLVLALGLSVAAHATPTIVAPDIELNVFESTHVVTFNVTGGDQVRGYDFGMEIFSFEGLPTGPNISSVDLITGTILEGNNIGQFNIGPVLPAHTTLFTTGTDEGTVTAAGLLATVNLDYTGLNSGFFYYRLDIGFSAGEGMDLFPNIQYTTEFQGTPVSQILFVIPEPEPQTLVLAGFGVMTLAAVAARRRRRRSAGLPTA